MPTTTGDLNLPEPLGSDPVSELRIAVDAIAVALGNATTNLSGTLVSRPAASAVPSFTVYEATDTGVWYESNGSVWLTVMLAGAWQNLTLASGISHATYVSTYTPQARLEGDVVRLRGGIVNSSGSQIFATTPIFTMPAGLAPASVAVLNTIIMNNAGGTMAYPLQIATSGVATTTFSAPANWSNAAWMSLDGITCPLN